MNLVDFLKSLSVADREEMAARAGTTGTYLTSIIYRRTGAKNLAIAIEAYKQSNGAFDPIESLSKGYWNDKKHATNVDWEALYECLQKHFANRDAELNRLVDQDIDAKFEKRMREAFDRILLEQHTQM